MTPFRIASLVAAAVVAFVVLATLGVAYSASSDWAAKVDGRQISEREYLRELAQFRANKAIESLVPGLADLSEGSVGSELAAGWLGGLIENEVMQAEVERRDIAVTREHRQRAEQRVVQDFGGPEVFGAFDDWFQERIIERNARFLAFLEAVAEPPSEEELREIYEADPAPYSRTCSSHILVETEEEAVEIRTLLDEGADFAELARERSIDPGSGQAGGDLGCNPPGTFVPEFETALESLSEGEISQPVQSDFGWHVIRLDERQGSFEEARGQIEEQATGQAQQEAIGILVERLQQADVEVSAKYGSYQFTPQGPQVVPPDRPSPPQGRPSGEEAPAEEIPGLFPPGA